MKPRHLFVFFTQLTLCGQGLKVKCALAKNLNPGMGNLRVSVEEPLRKRQWQTAFAILLRQLQYLNISVIDTSMIVISD